MKNSSINQKGEGMGRDRSQSLVVRGNKILLVKQNVGKIFYCLPGGGIEPNETPEMAALRELKEECNVEGTILMRTSVQYNPRNDGEVYTFFADISNQRVSKGFDPERNNQSIVGVEWKTLEEISERDRAYLWSAGLKSIPDFYRILHSWGDSISYPIYI